MAGTRNSDGTVTRATPGKTARPGGTTTAPRRSPMAVTTGGSASSDPRVRKNPGTVVDPTAG